MNEPVNEFLTGIIDIITIVGLIVFGIVFGIALYFFNIIIAGAYLIILSIFLAFKFKKDYQEATTDIWGHKKKIFDQDEKKDLIFDVIFFSVIFLVGIVSILFGLFS